MSGGSYDYLYLASDLWELATKRDALERMRDRLANLSWARTASDETERLCAALERIDSRIRNADALRDVWHAIEWWDSADYGEDAAREAVRDYDDQTAA